MSAIKDMYGKAQLSEEKKAELKAALVQRFPQYAGTADKTEVIKMNDNKLNESSGRIKVRSKWRTGAVIAAAAMIAVMGGMKLARDRYAEVSQRLPAGYEEEEFTTRNDNTPSSESEEEGNLSAKYAENSPLFSKYHVEEMNALAKEIYNAAAAAFCDAEDKGEKIVFGSEDDKVITGDMLIRARDEELFHEEGKLSPMEYASMMNKYLGDVDIEGRDAAVIFELDETGTIDPGSMRAYVYNDDSHSEYFCYPIYVNKNDEFEEREVNTDYSSDCAKQLYNEAVEILGEFSRAGVRFKFEKVNANNLLEEKDNEYYEIFDDANEQTEEMKFSAALIYENSIAAQIANDGHHYVISFDRDSSGYVTGVREANVMIYDAGNYYSEGEKTRYTYPDNRGEAPDDMN